ncbi:MAG: ABC transporter permease, partial [Leuconostoc falkenbergense]
GLGVVMIVATPLLSAISLKLIGLAPFLKWNPFNIYLGMSNLGMLSPSLVKQAMNISQNDLIIVYFIYIILMYGIAYLIFKKRSV